LHVFLSYARSSEDKASFAEEALRNEGYTVWRDSDLPAHLSYAEVIEERLKSAKAVLVLWSAEAAKSQWVRAEADAARELGTLMQSSVDGSVPPIPFNQIQCANLKGWEGEADHPGWRKLLSSVRALAGQSEETVKAARKRKKSSICVLPFRNKSDDAVPDYFCDGLSEDIISDLAKVPAVAVAPRKSAFAFKGQDVDAAAVAEQLGVTYVLEGAVLRAGDRVRITAQLVDGLSGEQIWSDRYHRDFTDVFSIQEEIASTIVEALKDHLAPETDQSDAPAEAAKPRRAKAPAVAAPPEEPVADEVEEFITAETEPEQDGQMLYANGVSTGWDSGEQDYYPDYDDDDDGLIRRGRFDSDNLPKFVAMGVLALLVALAAYFLWPSSAEPPPAPTAEKLSFVAVAPVNVRSLPSRTNSRILGTIDKGETINVVPNLAGAQPDWLKIEDGPYVGGYVWRESTRPVGEGADGKAADDKPRTDATG